MDDTLGSSVDDTDCDGIPNVDDCDSAHYTPDAADDCDNDQVTYADDCNDMDDTLGDIANDGDCDGVLTNDDCDDDDPLYGIICACDVSLPAVSSVVGHGAVTANPFEEGTSNRISGHTPPQVYAELTSEDAFNFTDGSEYDISDPNVNVPSSFVLTDLGHYVDGDAGTEIFGSYVGLTLDINNPNDWYYRLSDDKEFRHYRGGSLVLSSVDSMGNYTVVATYDIQDFLLIVNWGTINTGTGDGAMEILATMTDNAGTTGNLHVDPNKISIHVFSDDAIIAVNGNSTEGPWAVYEADGSFFAQPSGDSDCDGVNDDVECEPADPHTTVTTYEDGDCDGYLTASDCDDLDDLVPSVNPCPGADIPLILSEIADPNPEWQARYVEIFNKSQNPVDLTLWEIVRFANANTSSSSVQLSGTIPAGGVYVVANNLVAFQDKFGFDPDLVSGIISGNGDDTYALAEDSVIVDLFGDIGWADQNSPGAWDYENSSATRVAGANASTTFDVNEWDIASGAAAYTPGTHDDGNIGGPWSHTIVIDGDMSDWFAEELYPTTSGGMGAITWDVDYIYVAMNQADIATPTTSQWIVVYANTSKIGTPLGFALNTQTPDLSFPAAIGVAVKLDLTYSMLKTWNVSSWEHTDNYLVAADVAKDADMLEMRIPRSLLPDTPLLDIHVNLVNEASGGEWTYSGLPGVSFVDGYNPSFDAHLQFDLNGPVPQGTVKHGSSMCTNVCGDVNGDTSYNVNDLTLAGAYVNSGGSLSPCEFWAADVDADSDVDTDDLGLLFDWVDQSPTTPYPGCK